MPEKGVVCLFHREIEWERKQRVPKGFDQGPLGDKGYFLTHPECCARTNGNRQTFSTHVVPPGDQNYIPLPVKRPLDRSKRGKDVRSNPFVCWECHRGEDADNADSMDDVVVFDGKEDVVEHERKDIGEHERKFIKTPEYLAVPAAEYLNSLQITGKIFSNFRGKELVFVISNEVLDHSFVFRVGFGLEGHCFWMPTHWYREIVSSPHVPRGERGRAYEIPAKFCKGPVDAPRLLSVQAAFVRARWTLIFCDHNVLITFHVMRLRGLFVPEDIQPGSSLWPALWSKSHGPVFCHEPTATVAAIEQWRRRMIATSEKRAIFLVMKSSQDVVNGTGAQEATDQLQLALISPLMPTCQVCQSDVIWARFYQVFVDYEATRLALASNTSTLPHISNDSPIRFNTDGHTRYLLRINTYRRKTSRLSLENFRQAQELGLFNPKATIQPDVVPNTTSIFGRDGGPTVSTGSRADQRFKFVPNYEVTIASSKHKLYTPFVAQGGEGWPKVLSWSPVETDVSQVVNKTTLGLYSFRLFVDQTWSVQHVKDKPLPPRLPFTAGNARCKRPRAETIAKSGAAAKKRKVNMVEGNEENFDPNEGRMTRSMTCK